MFCPAVGKVSRPTDVPSSLSEVLRTFTAAVVTGGSSGLGRAFIWNALTLHPELRVCNLSRSSPEKFSAEKSLHHIPCDLGRPEDVEHAARQVESWLERTPSGRVLLINNSGFGTYGPFPEPNLKANLEMIDVNIRGLVDLTGRLLPTWRSRGGAIVNVASTAAFVPVVYIAAYAASKAFVLHWSLALGEELRGSNIQVLAVCPGTTQTAFFDRAGVSAASLQGRMMQSPDEVVLEAYRALAAGRPQVITGWRNRLMMGMATKLPKPLATRITARIVGKFWREQQKRA